MSQPLHPFRPFSHDALYLIVPDAHGSPNVPFVTRCPGASDSESMRTSLLQANVVIRLSDMMVLKNRFGPNNVIVSGYTEYVVDSSSLFNNPKADWNF